MSAALTATKTCTKCRQTRPLDAFYRQPDTRDGHRADCKTCSAAHQRDYWARRRAGLPTRQQLLRDEQPVCICDQPATGPGCDRCGHRHTAGMCHYCHLPAGPQFAELRRAWRDHLAGRTAA